MAVAFPDCFLSPLPEPIRPMTCLGKPLYVPPLNRSYHRPKRLASGFVNFFWQYSVLWLNPPGRFISEWSERLEWLTFWSWWNSAKFIPDFV